MVCKNLSVDLCLQSRIICQLTILPCTGAGINLIKIFSFVPFYTQIANKFGNLNVIGQNYSGTSFAVSCGTNTNKEIISWQTVYFSPYQIYILTKLTKYLFP